MGESRKQIPWTRIGRIAAVAMLVGYFAYVFGPWIVKALGGPVLLHLNYFH